MEAQSNEPKHEHLAPRGTNATPRRVLHLVERVSKHAVSE